MTDDQRELILRAKEDMRAARLLQSGGFFDGVARYAYYIMFHIAEAFLLEQDLAYSKHTATIAAFGKQYCLTGIVPREFHQFLKQAQKLRHNADYVTGPRIAPEIAQLQLARAENFVDVAEEILGPVSSHSEEDF